jgi:hypothetical protein
MEILLESEAGVLFRLTGCQPRLVADKEVIDKAHKSLNRTGRPKAGFAQAGEVAHP